MGLPDLPFHARLDALSAFFLLLLGAVSAGVSVYAGGYFRQAQGTAPGLICLYFHVFLASMALVMVADDAYFFMVAWETMALSSFFLVTCDHDKPEIRSAGYLYLLIAHIGAIAILMCFGALQAGTGDYTFEHMRGLQPSAAWATAAFLLALVGFGAKAGIVPLHVWLPEAHPAAPRLLGSWVSMRSRRKANSTGPTRGSRNCRQPDYPGYCFPLLPPFALQGPSRDEQNASPQSQPETAMFATLTLPAAIDLTIPQRTPTVRVRSADELRNAPRHARANAVRLDGSGMDRVLQFNDKRRLIEVQAATSWAELARYLASRKIAIDAFARMQGTVGEAAVQAAAGPDGLPVSAHVAAITLCTSEGELRRADRNAYPDLFRLALGGQGVIGVLYSVTLSIDSLRKSAAAAAAPVELRIQEEPATPAPECSIECLLPPTALDAFLKDLRLLADERRIALHGITVRRYQPEAETNLRWARQERAGVEVRFGIKQTLGASVAAAEVRRALLNAALSHGGSFPIRDLRDATRRQLESCYPMIGAFFADKRRGDPAERLQNAWYRGLTATMRGEPCAVRWGKTD